jgi:hypothetical protein
MTKTTLKMIGQRGKNVLKARHGMLAAGAIGLASIAMAPTPAQADFRIGVSINEPARRVETASQVWVGPVYRTVTERVWVAPVYTTITENVWVPEQIQYREYPQGSGADRWVERVPVGVIPAHYERQSRQVESIPGHWEDVVRQELVSAGHWESRVVVVTPPQSSIWLGYDWNQRDRGDRHDWDRSSRYDRDRHDWNRGGNDRGRSGNRPGGRR